MSWIIKLNSVKISVLNPVWLYIPITSIFGRERQDRPGVQCHPQLLIKFGYTASSKPS